MSDTKLLNTPNNDCCPAAQTPADSPDGVASNSQAYMDHNNAIANEALECALSLKAEPPLTFQGADNETVTFDPSTGVVTFNSPDNTKCPRIDPATGDIVFDLVDEDGNVIQSAVDTISTGSSVGPSVIAVSYTHLTLPTNREV